MSELKPSADRKTRFWPSQKNTFGLMPGPDYTCPCATLGPGGCCYIPKGRKNPDCYVYNIISAYPGVRKVLEHNTCLLVDADYHEKVRLLSSEFSRFRRTELRRKEPKLYYRLHWAGDVFNEEYAKALRVAMTAYPDIHFWAYTRSFPTVSELSKTKNLTLYLSLDAINFAEGMQTYFEWCDQRKDRDNVQICYMAKENDFADRYLKVYYTNEVSRTLQEYVNGPCSSEPSIWPEPPAPMDLRACPADVGKMPKEDACAKCQKCLGSKKPPSPVWFAS